MAHRDRGPAWPPARSPASCLRSSSADCSSVILPAKGPGRRRGFRRVEDRLWGLLELGVLRNPGPHDGSTEAEGGRTEAAVAAPRCRCESARFSSLRSASHPEGEGTRAAAARTGTSLGRFPPSTRPSAPPVPSPATASQSVRPLRAGALWLPTKGSTRPPALPICLPAPPPAAESRPLRAVAPIAAIFGRSTPRSLLRPQAVDSPQTP